MNEAMKQALTPEVMGRTPWTCVYCGVVIPKSHDVEELKAHVLACEEHPAGRLLRALEALVEAAPTFAAIGQPMPPSWEAADTLLTELKAARA